MDYTYASLACSFQLHLLLFLEGRSTYQDDGGLLHVPGNLLYKELAQACCPSGDEIAPALFPGEASRRGDLCMLLPLSDPTLAVSITHVRLLRSELVLTQPGEQIPFIWF